MAINKDTVKYVAHLARLELKDKELDTLSKQLQGIVDFIDKLKKVKVDKVSPTSHILAINNIYRDDKVRASLPVDQALMNAPKAKDNFFVVPKVIE